MISINLLSQMLRYVHLHMTRIKANKSNAGKYKSFLNVNSKNSKDLKNKIKEVIKSYKNLKKNQNFLFRTW